jgi:quercetin dioxygenase-like cupin family protein
MKIHNIDEFKGGWFLGDFEPSLYKTCQFEVSYKRHAKGEVWPKHFHPIATEFNCLVQGAMVIQDIPLKPGDVFVIEPGEVADPVFLEDCHLIVVKIPSIPGDKYEV